MKKLITVIAIVLGVLILVCAGVVVWTYQTAREVYNDPWSAFEAPEAQVHEIKKAEPVKESEEQPEEAAEPEQEVTYVKTQKMVNILLLGIDSNAEREAQHKGYRSDVMMLCTFDMENNAINLLSFPRDLYVDVYTMNTKTGEVTGTTKNRINTAYSHGGGPKKYGAKDAMLTVENVLSMDGQFDVDVDYFVSLDIDALPKIAKAVGPVDVELNANVAGLGKKGQVVTVTDRNIDTYIRDRKTSGGDYSRAERQQRYIIEVAKKMQKEGAVKMATSVYQKIASDIQTNLTIDQITAVAGFVQDFNMDALTRHAVEATGGRTETGASIQKLNKEALKNYLLEYFYDEKTN